MRNLVLFVLALLIGCGPSSAEIRTAKMATYRGDASTMFGVVEATVAEEYKIAEVDQDRYVLATQPQWYSPEGGRQSAGAGDFVQLSDRSVQLMMFVELAEPGANGEFAVNIVPKVFQHLAGSPKPRELAPEDPNMPGWVHGRVETLYVDIHKRLQSFKVQ